MTMNVEQDKMISGFSKLTKTEKIQWIARQFFHGEESAVVEELMEFWHEDGRLQKTIDGFSENTISNFYMPYGVAPNFLIDGKSYCVPMVIEESSVVAAAAAAAKFWMTRGGFQTEILGSTKIGQVHFSWKGNVEKLRVMFPQIKEQLLADTNHITHNMRNRGGGVSDIELLDFTHLEAELYQLRVSFETCDSMGANFINSVLEEMGRSLVCFCGKQEHFTKEEKELTIIMAILSNYTPDCVVRASVECSIEELGEFPDNMSAETFAEKFYKAVRIATIDPYRATTHNKGIFNGIDSVILATANDFRAIEAGGHTYASQSGQYRSLSHCTIVDGIFKFWLDIPLAVGTVGGLTKLHPLAKRSLQLLDNPTAHELMSIIATVGLAQNFAALRSLTTTGIQKGHMKMHLLNILNHMNATEKETQMVISHFSDCVVSFSGVRDFLAELRG